MDRWLLRILVPKENAAQLPQKALERDVEGTITNHPNSPDSVVEINIPVWTAADWVRKIICTLRRPKQTIPTTEVVLKLLLHNEDVGSLLGPAGERVSKIRKDSGVDIRLYTVICPFSDERVLRLHGESEAVVKAIISILSTIEKHQDALPRRRHPYDPANYSEERAGVWGGRESGPDESREANADPENQKKDEGEDKKKDAEDVAEGENNENKEEEREQNEVVKIPERRDASTQVEKGETNNDAFTQTAANDPPPITTILETLGVPFAYDPNQQTSRDSPTIIIINSASPSPRRDAHPQ